MAASQKGNTQESSTCAPHTPQGGARQARKATNNSAPGHGWDIGIVQ